MDGGFTLARCGIAAGAAGIAPGMPAPAPGMPAPGAPAPPIGRGESSIVLRGEQGRDGFSLNGAP